MAAFSERGQRLLTHLQSGVTQVCRCWRVARRDGVVLGFTDHDRDLRFGGRVFEAATGFTATALEQTTGLAVDNSEAAGALSAAAISEADIEAGRYDGAEVTCWLVNWADPSERLVQFRGSIGEMSRRGDAFRAELRGLTEALNQPQGRVYQSMCSATLGDRACGVDLDQPGFAVETVVLDASQAAMVQVPDDGTTDSGWFERGRLIVLDGAAEGLVAIIKRDRVQGGSRALELWQELRLGVTAGDRVRIEAGCDKRAGTCREKFCNFNNFRGFPHIPGEDWITTYPKRGEDNDGGSRDG